MGHIANIGRFIHLITSKFNAPRYNSVFLGDLTDHAILPREEIFGIIKQLIYDFGKYHNYDPMKYSLLSYLPKQGANDTLLPGKILPMPAVERCLGFL